MYDNIVRHVVEQVRDLLGADDLARSLTRLRQGRARGNAGLGFRRGAQSRQIGGVFNTAGAIMGAVAEKLTPAT